MKKPTEIEAAAERAAQLQNNAQKSGRSEYPAMTYEDGLREALDWVCDYEDCDPTK